VSIEERYRVEARKGEVRAGANAQRHGPK
jgi:hypothetical protein